jgi:hypothetical protein
MVTGEDSTVSMRLSGNRRPRWLSPRDPKYAGRSEIEGINAELLECEEGDDGEDGWA